MNYTFESTGLFTSQLFDLSTCTCNLEKSELIEGRTFFCFYFCAHIWNGNFLSRLLTLKLTARKVSTFFKNFFFLPHKFRGAVTPLLSPHRSFLPGSLKLTRMQNFFTSLHRLQTLRLQSGKQLFRLWRNNVQEADEKVPEPGRLRGRTLGGCGGGRWRHGRKRSPGRVLLEFFSAPRFRRRTRKRSVSKTIKKNIFKKTYVFLFE